MIARQQQPKNIPQATSNSWGESGNTKIHIRRAVENFVLLIPLFTLLTVYGNWAWFTGDESLSAYIPPFEAGYNIGGQEHLGGEYYNIAEAIYDGRGYSDPFGDETGATGWSPPVLPYLMSVGLRLVGGSKGALTVCFFGMQACVLALTTTIFLSFADFFKQSNLALIAVVIVVVPNFKWMFQLTHDCVFQMLWIDLILLGLWAWRFPLDQTWKTIVWGFFGGLCALCSPIVGFAWAATTVATWGPRLLR